MVWAFAEALAWPVVPDFILFPLVLAAPARMFPLVVAAVMGSATGGLVAYVLGSTGLGTTLLGAAPLVTDPMVAEASRELAGRGAAGLLAQPLSGIPYKAFALQAAEAGVPPFAYLAVGALARGGRFLAVAVVAAALGRLARPLWERALPLFLTLYAVAFVAGLARVVSSWAPR
jgi:membrane protein YqaA with SNARE-associated domain